MNASRTRGSAPAERVTRVVDLLAEHPGERFTLSELVDELGLSISTLHSILTTLTQRRWVSRRERDKTYSIGPRMADIAAAARRAVPGLEALDAEVERLTLDLGVVCSASTIEGDEIVIVTQSRPPGVDDPSTRVGQRLPFGAPFGAAFVAWGGDGDLEDWLERAPLGISSEERRLYARAFEGLRQRGHGIERFDIPRAQLHEALVGLRAEGTAAEVIDQIRTILPNITLRELLPEELDRLDTLDVAMVHAPVRGVDGGVIYNLAAHLRRDGMTRRELRRAARAVTRSADRCTRALQDAS